MASPQAEAFHEMVRQYRESVLGNDTLPTLEEMRAASEASLELVGVMPDGVTVTDTTAAGRAARWLDPDGAATDRVVLYFHGGAYVVNSINSHTKLASGIAKAVGCRVLLFDYRKAPEHPFPAAVEDGLAAYRWLLDQGFTPENVAISGDSAGGGLTLATLCSARDAGVPQPAAAVTLSAWSDLEGTGATMTSHEGFDLMVDRVAMQNMAAIYLNGTPATAPLASPVHADLSGLAPLYLQVGGHETLLDDSTRVAVRAAHAGVAVRLDVFPEMQHVFQSALGMLPESDDALARIGAYLRERFRL